MDLNVKAVYYLKQDLEGLKDMGQEIRVGQGKIHSQIADFGHILKYKFRKINKTSLHDALEGFKEGVIGCLFG